MSKITLDIEERNIETVLTILNNLKPGLIQNMSYSNNDIKSRMQAKKVIKQEKVEEDEFFSKTPSSGKYLSKSAFKNKLQKGR